jgi:two-component system sensor histidine kinase BarA
MGTLGSPPAPSDEPLKRHGTLAFRARLLAVAWLPAAVSVLALSLVVVGYRLERRVENEGRKAAALARTFAQSAGRDALDPARERALVAALVRRRAVRSVVLRLPRGAVIHLARPRRPLPWFAAAIVPAVRLLVPRTVPAVFETRLAHTPGGTFTLRTAARPLLRRDARTVLRALLLVLLALGLSFVLALRFLRTILRPLEQLTGAFDRLRAGDLETRVPDASPGEFGRLARHFNRMAERVAAHRSELESRISQATGELRATLERMEKKNEELEATRRAAESANRAKTEFLANMSHEIRTPMNAVLGYSDLLAGSGLDHDQQSYLEAIRVSGESLLRLIDEILDLARIETGHLRLVHERCDPKALAEQVSDMLAPQAYRKGLEFITDFYAEPTRPVLGDRDKIRQILTNLVANAIKFTDRGTIAVTLHQHDDGDRVAYEALVEDTGVGVAEEARTRIFEPFIQADGSISRSHGGAGLGLAIARRLVEAMGGSLTHRARAGGGSLFRVRLTLPACGPASAPADRDPLLAGRRALVLCADADRARRIAAILKAWGVVPTTVSGAELARTPHAAAADFAILALGVDETGSETPWRGRWRPPPTWPVLVLAATADRGRLRRFARHFGGPCLPVHAAQDEIRARLHGLLNPLAVPNLVVDPDIERLLREELPHERRALSDPRVEAEELGERLHRLEGTARFCRLEVLTKAIGKARDELARGTEPARALAPVREAIDAVLAGLRPPAPCPPRSRTSRLDKLTILAADDNRLNRELVTLMLARHGARVEACPDGRSVLARAGETPWQAALLDVHMPDVDGLSVIVDLRRRFPERPILALSADVFAETRRAAESAGALDYLVKPVDEERLVSAVLAVLARPLAGRGAPAA